MTAHLETCLEKHWDILGQSDQTTNLHKKRLTIGYKRPKKLRDKLVNANITRLAGYELIDRLYVAPAPPKATTNVHATTLPNITTRQASFVDYLTAVAPGNTNTETPDPLSVVPSTSRTRLLGTDQAKKNFPFCKHTICRFCPKLNYLGKITSYTKGTEYNCMKKYHE